MADSLQDQLRKAGLVSDKQLRKAERVKHAADMERKAHGARDGATAAAERTRADKAQRDRQLNEERDRRANEKAIAAQIKQLIELNLQARGDADVAYNFVDARAVRKLLVSKQQRDALAAGRLAIVRLDERFELVPAAVAQKIRERDPSVVVVCNDPDTAAAPLADDPYAKYQIPEDLDW